MMLLLRWAWGVKRRKRKQSGGWKDTAGPVDDVEDAREGV
jgi:hypothetical protein